MYYYYSKTRLKRMSNGGMTKISVHYHSRLEQPPTALANGFVCNNFIVEDGSMSTCYKPDTKMTWNYPGGLFTGGSVVKKKCEVAFQTSTLSKIRQHSQNSIPK
jgi:hypothetical protein